MNTAIIPSFLRPGVLERVAEGWPAARIAKWLTEKFDLTVTRSDVLSALKQMNADRAEVATAIVREHLRAELPAVLSDLSALRARAKSYEMEARAAYDWSAVRGFIGEQRNGIALALRYSGAADPEEKSAEASAVIEKELSAALDALQRGLDDATFKRVTFLLIEMGRARGDKLPTFP